jgi:hypothetical protein
MSTRVTKAELLDKLAEADRMNNLYGKTIDVLYDELTMLREQLEAETILRERAENAFEVIVERVAELPDKARRWWRRG